MIQSEHFLEGEKLNHQIDFVLFSFFLIFPLSSERTATALQQTEAKATKEGKREREREGVKPHQKEERELFPVTGRY